MAQLETQCRKLTHAGYIQEPQLHKVKIAHTTGSGYVVISLLGLCISQELNSGFMRKFRI